MTQIGRTSRRMVVSSIAIMAMLVLLGLFHGGWSLLTRSHRRLS